MPLDKERARAETPGCSRVLHLNSAGAALLPSVTVNATIDYLRLESEIGGYEAAHKERARVDRVYQAAATMINCASSEIAVIENATRAWDMAFYSLPFGKDDRILTSAAEYASNYVAFLQIRARCGVEITIIPNDESGQLSVTALERAIDDRTKLIAVTHVPTNGGLVNPAQEIGRVAREANVLYLLDACQSVGQLPIDVQSIQCDFLSATGRKFLRAPRGTGLLYVRENLVRTIEPVFIDLFAAKWIARDRYELRPDARRFENWETNYAGKVGLGVAIDYLLDWGIENIWDEVCSLAAWFRERLKEVEGVIVRDVGSHRCGIVTFTKKGVNPQALTERMRDQGVNIWFSDVSSTRVDMEERELTEVVRASVHYYNTRAEIERFCRLLEVDEGDD